MKKWMIGSGIMVVLVALVAVFSFGSVTMAQGPGEGPPDGPPPCGDDFRGGPANSPISILAEELDMTPAEILSELQEGKSIAQLAEEHGVDVDTIIDRVVETHAERLQTLVDNGRITQEQADSRLETIRERVTEKVNEVWSEETMPPRPRHPRGPGGSPRDGSPRGGPADSPVSILADELDMTPAEILSELQEGKSIAQLAAERGVDVDTIIDRVVEAHAERLQTLVDDGRITQEQADSRLETVRERVTEKVNEVWSENTMPPHPRPRRGGGSGASDTSV
jgi:lambda repressor-like predicted transcriptional regulator